MLLPGHARPPPAPQPAQHPGLRRQVEPPAQFLRLFYCTVLVCSKEIAALTDFSGYLTKLLQNHTAYACDGDHLHLQCPRHSTISVQSAFYGQDYQMCRAQQPASQREDGVACVAPTTLQKVLDECQSRRACHLLVNSRVFGPDLCPGSSKYLLVSFKCQPKNKRGAQALNFRCTLVPRGKAQHGRETGEAGVCFFKIFLFWFLVPKNILSAIDPAVANLKPSLKQKDDEYGINFDPREPRVLRKDGVIVSNSLAAFAYIRAHPERAALLFVSSVCIGLALTLCTLVIRVSCTKDFRELQLAREHLVPESDKAEENSEDEEGEEDSSDSDFPGELSGFCRTSYPVYSSIEAAELAERIERREQIIQEIWMNSGLDTSLPRNMGQFY
uniref:Eva-1 homolog C n=1 Tax=Ailuropoda melanoleuca TaxID=9646 RepID=A0A7N5K7H8_AILME